MSRPTPKRKARSKSLAPIAAYGSFQGAEQSSSRGYVYFPSIDTRREVDTYSRLELLRRARFLYNNVGLVRRIVNGISRLVAGTGLSPQALTTDSAWNAKAERHFTERAGQRFVFDVGGRYDFFSAQRAIMRQRLRDGDCAAILTESAAGTPRVRMYESHQIGDIDKPWGASADATDPWRDGVMHNRDNRPVAYRILGDAGASVVVPAEDVIFFADYERIGQSRGLTILYHAVNNLLDTTEIVSFFKQGIKASNQLGFYISEDATKDGPQGLPGRIRAAKATTVGGTAATVTQDKLFAAGQIQELNPGQELKVLHDQRPHPNALGLLDWCIRDISWGCGLSPEVLWNIASLGGANTRFVMADTQTFVEEQQQELIDLYCSRFWVYFVAKEIKSGRIDKPSDPEWWKHGWVPPPRQTVDFGRDGRLYLEQHRAGLLTSKRWNMMQGLDWKTEADQFIEERVYLRDTAAARGLSFAELLPPAPGQAPAAAAPPTSADEDPEPTGNKSTEQPADS